MERLDPTARTGRTVPLAPLRLIVLRMTGVGGDGCAVLRTRS